MYIIDRIRLGLYNTLVRDSVDKNVLIPLEDVEDVLREADETLSIVLENTDECDCEDWRDDYDTYDPNIGASPKRVQCHYDDEVHDTYDPDDDNECVMDARLN